MTLLIITGTPGTGKSTLARWLSKKLHFSHFDLPQHYLDVADTYNYKKDCYDIDQEKFEKLVLEKLQKEKDLLVDTHIAHYLPKSLVDLCLVLTCKDLKELHKRLKVRKYSERKIKENLEAEIFQICLQEAQKNGHKIMVFDSSKNLNKEKILLQIKKALKR